MHKIILSRIYNQIENKFQGFLSFFENRASEIFKVFFTEIIQCRSVVIIRKMVKQNFNVGKKRINQLNFFLFFRMPSSHVTASAFDIIYLVADNLVPTLSAL